MVTQESPNSEDDGAEMRMIRLIYDHTMGDKIRNEVIHDKVGVTPEEDNMG